LINFLTPFQQKQKTLLKNKDYLQNVLKDGQNRAHAIAQKTMSDVKKKIGLI